MTLTKSQITVFRLVVIVACVGLIGWMWWQSERSRQPPTVGTWVEKLQSGDADDRRYAIQELSNFGGEHAEAVAPALIKVLGDRKPSVRNEAALALGRYLADAVKHRGSALTGLC